MGNQSRIHQSLHVVKRKRSPWVEHDTRTVPLSVVVALREAMKREEVSAGEFDDLLWLIAQESSGEVDARNTHSTARGLFQLLRNQYGLNPNGVKSFGDATEECEGGIRYVMGRYRSARAARMFWEAHHWY
ncbi:MAG: hypothetical protein V4463_18005 [Pseudomonadota bacterium]